MEEFVMMVRRGQTSDGVATPVFGAMFFRVRWGIASLILRRATAVVCGHSRNYFEDSSFAVATSQLTNLLNFLAQLCESVHNLPVLAAPFINRGTMNTVSGLEIESFFANQSID